MLTQCSERKIYTIRDFLDHDLESLRNGHSTPENLKAKLEQIERTNQRIYKFAVEKILKG